MLDIFIINKGFGEFGGSKLGVIVMFPTKGISKVQRQQMVSYTAHNVKVAMLLLVMLTCCPSLVAMLPLVMMSAKMSHTPHLLRWLLLREISMTANVLSSPCLLRRR